MAAERQCSALPPAQPSYILRGHASQIHSVRFVRHNTRLLTGDADGWIVFWKLETKRALAVWKAHDGAILGAAEWGHDRVITHGRDNTLRIWQLRVSDESALSTTLPADQASESRPKPWLLHTLPVNTLNFCSFSMCPSFLLQGHLDSRASSETVHSESSRSSILIAVPATDDKKIDVYGFPEEKLRYVVPRIQAVDSGMIMAVKLVHHKPSNNILLLSGYESGLTAVHILPRNNRPSALDIAQLVYLSKPHAQPVLSLDVLPDATLYFTSSADAVIAAHRVPELRNERAEAEDLAIFNSPGSDQAIDANAFESIRLEENAKRDIPAPASIDPSLQYSDPSTSLADHLTFSRRAISSNSSITSGISSLIAAAPSVKRTKPPPPAALLTTIQPAHKTVSTKHSGQQSLCVRSDGRLLVTGGWDSRIRIYSAKTLKEVAVLKWHKEGVYAVDFSKVFDTDAENSGRTEVDETVEGGGRERIASGEIIKKETGLARLQRKREEAIQKTHWVVAGAKDGKVSLWEVF